MYNEYPKSKNKANYYLYCIRNRLGGEFHAPGIFDMESVFTLPCKNLEAVVSKVPPDQFDVAEIERRAQEDVEWIKEKALRHEAIVEQAMRNPTAIHPVIPMRFGTIFNSVDKIERLLSDNCSRYCDALSRLSNKQEWTVKVYLARPDVIRKNIINNDASIRGEQEKLSGMPKGMAYFMQRQIDESMEKVMNKKISEDRRTLMEKLGKYAIEQREGKILGAEFTGKKEQMILNAIFLIHTTRVADLVSNVTCLNDNMESHGFQFECGGPFPPYNFVELD